MSAAKNGAEQQCPHCHFPLRGGQARCPGCWMPVFGTSTSAASTPRGVGAPSFAQMSSVKRPSGTEVLVFEVGLDKGKPSAEPEPTIEHEVEQEHEPEHEPSAAGPGILGRSSSDTVIDVVGLDAGFDQSERETDRLEEPPNELDEGANELSPAGDGKPAAHSQQRATPRLRLVPGGAGSPVPAPNVSDSAPRLDPAVAQALAAVSVELSSPAQAPPGQWYEAVHEAERWLKRPRVLARIMTRMWDAGPLDRLRRSLSSERAYRRHLAHTHKQLLYALSTAWLEAGAPGTIADGIEEPRSHSPSEAARRIDEIEQERDQAQDWFKRWRRRMELAMQERRRELSLLDRAVTDSRRALEMVEAQGDSGVRALGEELSEDLRAWLGGNRGVPLQPALRGRVEQLEGERDNAEDELTRARVALEQQQQKVTSRSANMQRQIDRLRAEQEEATRTNELQRAAIGARLEPLAHCFANGAETAATVQRLASALAESDRRLSRLAHLDAELARHLTGAAAAAVEEDEVLVVTEAHAG